MNDGGAQFRKFTISTLEFQVENSVLEDARHKTETKNQPRTIVEDFISSPPKLTYVDERGLSAADGRPIPVKAPPNPPSPHFRLTLVVMMNVIALVLLAFVLYLRRRKVP